MAKGSFWVSPDAENPRDIDFRVAPDTASIPDTQMQLRDDVDKVLTTLRMLFPDGDRRFTEYFRPLLSLAQAGLVGDNAQPELGIRALAELKNEITAREGGKIKNQYMKILGSWASGIALPFLTAGLILYFNYPTLIILANFFFLWTGCMAGVWLSFGSRKTFFRFEDLHIPEEDRMEPVVRLFFAGLLTVTIGLLFSLSAVVVTLGSISTEQINTSLRVALVIGLLGGFSEQALSTAVSKQAATLLDFGKSK